MNQQHSICILGHGTHSLRNYPQGIGEMQNAEILLEHLARLPIKNHGLIDICEWLNKPTHEMQQLLPSADGPVLLLLTFESWLQKITSTGVCRDYPTISRAYALHEYFFTPPHLLASSDLVITQGLLANQILIEEGVPPWKLLYFPCQIPLEIESIIANHDPSFRERYLNELAREMHKAPPEQKDLLIVGCSSRFEFRKNVEHLISAFKKILPHSPHAILLLKGDLDPRMDVHEGEGYSEHLATLLQELEQKPWFFWDRKRRSYEETLKIYQTFDVCVHLSGAEDPCNVVIEQMALAKPLLILDGGTRPYLFKNGAMFVDHTGHADMRRGNWLFFIPDKDDLQKKLSLLLNDAKLRQSLAEQAKTVAMQRFGPEVTISKTALMIEAAYHYHHRTDKADFYRERLLNEYESDLERFQLV